MRKISIILTLGLVLIFGLALQASALIVDDVTTFKSTLNITNTDLTPDFAELTITVPTGGGAATFTLTADNSYKIGDVFLNLTNTDVTLSDTTPSLSPKGPQNNISIFGDFNYTLGPSNSGFDGASTTEIFTLTPNSGSFADAFSVLTGNGAGFLEAVHIFFQNPDETVTTGFAGQPVPIPAALPLFGTGLLGLIGLGWRKMRA